MALAKCLDDQLEWDELPPEVKVCLMRLAMALDTEDEIARMAEPVARPAPAAAPVAPAPTTTAPAALVEQVVPGQEATPPAPADGAP